MMSQPGFSVCSRAVRRLVLTAHYGLREAFLYQRLIELARKAITLVVTMRRFRVRWYGPAIATPAKDEPHRAWQFVAMDTGLHDYNPFTINDAVTFVETEEELHQPECRVGCRGGGGTSALGPCGL